MNDETLARAIALARAGQKPQARVLLMQVIRADPLSELAWLWLADCAATPAERIQVLEACLRALPGSRKARAGLEHLRAANAALSEMPDTAENEPPNEWPAIRAQAEALPWYEQPAPGEVEPPPLDLAEDGAPEPAAVSPFSVLPDEVSPEEFARVEAQTAAALNRRPTVRPLKIQQAQAERQARRAAAKQDQLSPGQAALLVALVALGITGIGLLIAGLMGAW